MLSRYINVGLFYLRQLFFCKFDIVAHASKGAFGYPPLECASSNWRIDLDVDYTQLWHKLKEETTLTKDGDPTPGQSWFVHLAGGHDAGTSFTNLGAKSPLNLPFSRLLRVNETSQYNKTCCTNIFKRYTYALIFATDMYATVFKEDPLDTTCGRRYREKILLPGGSQDEIDLLQAS